MKKKLIWFAVGFLILFSVWLLLKIRAANRLIFSLQKIPKRFKISLDFVEWSHTVSISNIDSIAININGAAIKATINNRFAGQVFLEKDYRIAPNGITNIDFRVRCSVDDFIAVVVGDSLNKSQGNLFERIWNAIKSIEGKEVKANFDGTLYAEGFGLPYNETFTLKIPNI
jgi:hypothetical protein